MSGERIYRIGGRESDTPVGSDIVGGKAANLMRLHGLGLRVPPALALGTSLFTEYADAGTLPPSFRPALRDALRYLEQTGGATVGGRTPLLVSVRSSPPVSMPGMLETVLNAGLTPSGVSALIRRSGDPFLAWDSYRRFVRSYAEVVLGADAGVFDRAAAALLSRRGVDRLQDLDAASMRELARIHLESVETAVKLSIPEDPFDQIVGAVEAVLRSWRTPRAATYRRLNGIEDALGTGVLIQTMVFGNSGHRSGSGVGFTRDPSTGADSLYADFVVNAQGEDIVAGRHGVADAGALARLLPSVWLEIVEAKTTLEREFGDMQDFEFTVDDGQLYFLQTRSAKRTPWAALRVAIDLERAGVIDQATAARRLAAYDLDAIARSAIRPEPGDVVIAVGVPAGAGVATGAIVFDPARAQSRAQERVILVRTDVTTDDIAGMASAAGILTATGGRTSHAAVVARQLNKACIVGCQALKIDAASRSCRIGDRRLVEGDVITIDGDSGRVFSGTVPVIVERPDEDVALVRSWIADIPAAPMLVPVAAG
jgi:pyruvate,orthophosphate dikinase